MLDKDYNIKVGDFGLASMEGGNEDEDDNEDHGSEQEENAAGENDNDDAPLTQLAPKPLEQTKTAAKEKAAAEPKAPAKAAAKGKAAAKAAPEPLPREIRVATAGRQRYPKLQKC